MTLVDHVQEEIMAVVGGSVAVTEAVEMKEPRPRDGKGNQSFEEQLRRLEARVDNDITVEQFGNLVRQLVRSYAAPESVGRHYESAFLDVLIRSKCHRRLLAEITRALMADHAGRTVKSAASHAEVDRRTLERDWRNICTSHVLHDCMRLIVLLRMARAKGSEEEKARAVGITVRTARDAAMAVTGRRLSELMDYPV